MKVKIIEAGNDFNWGKFMVMRPDVEWEHHSAVPMGDSEYPSPGSVLAARGWAHWHFIVFDLETNEGATFGPQGGLASADLHKHRVWVCPMFEPFLNWLYEQDLSDLDKLPDYVDLPMAESALSGYRRAGYGFPLNSGIFED